LLTVESYVETRLNLTDAELAARLRLVVMRLARRLRQQAPVGVTPSQLSVLSTLSEKGPMTLGALAEAERVRPPTMTRIVMALEEDNLVERDHDTIDRRRVNVLLTETGRRLVASNRTRKTAYLADRLRDLPAEDRATLQRAEEVLEQILEDPD
jgi:DNA-binding MarR family transcriptional regulator